MPSAIVRSFLTLVTLLLVPMIVESTVSPESPNWEYILREFLFKTISPPPPGNNKLYKALLEAPFYRGPLTAEETPDNVENVSVLSSGEVYHLAKGSWIICQDGCVDCEICAVQKSQVVPTVKWTLRRIRRRDIPLAGGAGGSRRPYDIQLTISPQPDNSFHMKNISPSSYVYVTSNNGGFDSFTNDLIQENKEPLPYPFGTRKPQGRRKEHSDPEPYLQESVTANNGGFRTTSTLVPETQTRSKIIPGRKRGRDISQGERFDFEHTNHTQESTPLALFHPTTPETIHDDCTMEKYTRLILGRDQFGEKHLVHIVPAGNLDEEIERTSLHPNSDQSRVEHYPQSTILQHEDRPLYRKIFRRVMDSLNTHKVAIEKFLFSPNLEEHPGHEEAFVNPTVGIVVPIKGEKGSSGSFRSNNTTRNEGDSGFDDEGIIRQDGELTSTTSLLLEDHVTATVLNDTKSWLNINPGDFDEANSAEENLFDDLSSTEGDGSGSTLILKEVAKSVVDHPADTLQGFNSVAKTATPNPGSYDSLFTRTSEEGTTPKSLAYSDTGEKSAGGMRRSSV